MTDARQLDASYFVGIVMPVAVILVGTPFLGFCDDLVAATAMFVADGWFCVQ